MNANEVVYRGQALELLEEIGLEISRLLQTQHGVAAQDADAQGMAVATEICKRWGGGYIYIPRTIAIDEQHWKIYHEFTGSNVDELAHRYQMSTQWIYRIIKRCRLADLAKRQSDLFGAPQPQEVARPGRPSSPPDSN